MFTGITQLGLLQGVGHSAAGRELRVECDFANVEDGESIAINGVCLTVREHGTGWFSCAAMVTTRELTTVSDWQAGKRVNLERSLKVSDRLGGHFVTGHVDGVARVTHVEADSDALLIDLALPSGLSELTVERGSVTLDGVSLTIAALPGPDAIRVAIIEYTRRHTTLGELEKGDGVHVEMDVLAKYVRQMLSAKQ